MNCCFEIKLCIAMCFRKTFSFLLCVQAQFLLAFQLKKMS